MIFFLGNISWPDVKLRVIININKNFTYTVSVLIIINEIILLTQTMNKCVHYFPRNYRLSQVFLLIPHMNFTFTTKNFSCKIQNTKKIHKFPLTNFIEFPFHNCKAHTLDVLCIFYDRNRGKWGN